MDKSLKVREDERREIEKGEQNVDKEKRENEVWTLKSNDAILPPQGHWIEDSKKIGPETQEKALGFSWALG